MTTDYLARIQAILGAGLSQNQMSVTYNWNTIDEARRIVAELRQKKKELRLLKKEIGVAAKEIRSAYRMQRSEVQATFLSAFFGRRTAGTNRALQREDLKRQEESALVLHNRSTEVIDRALVQMDRVKLDAETWITRRKQST